MPSAIIALAPKCVLCVAAWFGLGTTLGWTGVELCGAPEDQGPDATTWLLVAGVALGVGALVVRTCSMHSGVHPRHLFICR